MGKESERNFFEYQPVFKDGDSPATLGYNDTNRIGDLRHCSN
jgi:hypothetical protein